MNLFKLHLELQETLSKNPELREQQDKLSLKLASIKSPEGRMYYLSIAMIDSFYDMKEELNKLNEMLNKIKE